MMHCIRLLFFLVVTLLPGIAAAQSAKPQAGHSPGVLYQDALVPLGGFGWLAQGFTLPEPNPKLPVMDPAEQGPGATLLRRLYARGKVAGLGGVLYDNRDRGHSTLPKSLFPGLTHLQYDDNLRGSGLDYGLAGQVYFPVPVIGNSSTAISSGPQARSQVRLAMTTPRGAERAFMSYAFNQLYIYPEHRDHDEVDYFPANWPYTVSSQGSSGRDRPFMRALLMTTAAFNKDTQAFLIGKGLLASTLQMILRRSQKAIYSREAYFTANAHPTAFPQSQLVPEKMVALAAAMKPGDIPPIVRLVVEEETFSTAAGLAGLSERLFDSPAAIARVWRGFDYTNSMTVSVASTEDPNGHDLTFNWVLLRGDPEKVRIVMLDGPGNRARIEFDWQESRQTVPEIARISHRVDIGVFAWNGTFDSAPSFISVSFPSHQQRRYERAGNEGKVKLKSVDYTADNGKAYFDPLIHWFADWRDEYEYDPSGEMSKWTRVAPEGSNVLFDITASTHPAAPTYKMLQKKAQLPRLIVRPRD